MFLHFNRAILPFVGFGLKLRWLMRKFAGLKKPATSP
jgi:hypothetical protein